MNTRDQIVTRLCRPRTVILCFALAYSLVGIPELHADGPLKRLRQSINSVRPGWIIPLPDESTGKSANDQPKKKAKPDTKKTAQKPNEAARPSIKSVQGDELELAPPHQRSSAPQEAAQQVELADAPREFGASVEDRDGKLTIVRINKTGAAAAAGLKVNDVIRSVGGVKLDRVDSLESILKGLDNGVVVEFELDRKKKAVKREVQFGTFQAQTPTVKEPSENNSSTNDNADSFPSLAPVLDASPDPILHPASTGGSTLKEIRNEPQQLQSVLISEGAAEALPPTLLDLVPTKPAPAVNKSKTIDELLDLSPVVEDE